MEDELTEKDINQLKSRVLFHVMLSIGLTGSLIVLILNLLQWYLLDWFTPFVAPFVYYLGHIMFFVSTLLVFVYFLVSKPGQRARRGIPLLINAVVLILVIVVPLDTIAIHVDYRLHKAEREEVIRLVLEGSLKPKEVDQAFEVLELPDPHQSLSKGGGEIIIAGNGQQLHVLFYTYRGVVDNYAGFFYSADGSLPKDRRFGDFVKIMKLDHHWYWVRAT